MAGPKSQFARYAYGYSNEKPHWSFWAIYAGMIAFIAVQIVRNLP